MKSFSKILFFLIGVVASKNIFAQSSTTKNTADKIYISPNVQWSDWGTNYSNGTNGNVSNNGTFIFNGRKFTNSGSYYSNAGSKDSFISSTIDTIAGTFRPRFYDVILNNGNNNFNITNDSGIYVAHNINMASLIVSTVRADSSTGALTLANGATYTGTMSNTKHVNGYVTKYGNGAFIFPIGHSGKYHPLTISAPSSTTAALSVAYFYSNPATNDPTGGNHSLSSLSAGLTSVDNSQFWDVVTVKAPMTVDVTINFESISNQYHNASTTRMVGWNVSTGKWEIIGSGRPTLMSNNGTITNSTVDLSKFSALGIGNTIEVLPVQLVSFTAQKINETEGLIQWQTASETNNDKFIVEHSTDLITYEILGEQNGAGNSHDLHDYKMTDANPYSGINYYRLKQMNYDGTFEYSNIVSLNFDKLTTINEDEKVELFNSLNDPTLHISVPSSWDATTFVLEIYNEAGQVIKQAESFTLSGGNSEIKSLGLLNAEHGFYVAVLSDVTQKRKRTFKVIR